ncbi:response regulator transcription factor [Leekyejoonella antrihumi]|uniref:Response regulator transcription factor n=1 Tax=Leekyejoonella antrihumi TaxID=1660198 RepID=A0A563E4X6_9MICO|nr:response regulator transcription factor [Leekyejoonella antrihumi]TWP36924.1 response regulator transcription factor [Leekyejoonella antrihumi]
MTIRVVIADDQPLIREGFRAILERAEDVCVVAEAANGREAVELVRQFQPDVVIMDVRMPQLDGIAATRQITTNPALAGTNVLVITAYEVDANVFEALRAGASGFLLKDLEPDDLRRAVSVVASGESLLAPSATKRLIAHFVATPQHPTGQEEKLTLLTEREREVLTLVGQGLTNSEIASRLFISPATAKTHVSRSMLKLDAHDRAQLVVFAYEAGIVGAG